jgi:predicted DNA-binding transcriptional regulator YafY
MTPHRFDAPASITRPASPSHDRARRPLVRIAWLIARFVRRDAVRFDLYEQRFGKSIRSFRRDIATLRDAGIYLDATHQGDYRMLCFRPERDAA